MEWPIFGLAFDGRCDRIVRGKFWRLYQVRLIGVYMCSVIMYILIGSRDDRKY